MTGGVNIQSLLSIFQCVNVNDLLFSFIYHTMFSAHLMILYPNVPFNTLQSYLGPLYHVQETGSSSGSS